MPHEMAGTKKGAKGAKGKSGKAKDGKAKKLASNVSAPCTHLIRAPCCC